MKNTVMLAALLAASGVMAQSTKEKPSDFYQLRDQFYKDHPQALPWNQTPGQSMQEENEGQSIPELKDGVVERFRRWEAFAEPRVYPTGKFIDPGTLMREYLKYQQKHPSSLRTGNWQLVGPAVVPEGGGLRGAGRINTIAVNPLDTNIIYLGTPCGGVWKSVDGGNTWNTNASNLLASISIGDIAINPIHPDTLYAATGDSYGFEYYGQGTGDFWGGTYSAGLMISADGGDTWNSTGLSYEQTDAQLIYRIIINPVNPNILIAGTRGGLYRSADAGATWSEVIDGNFFDAEFNTADVQTVYAVDDYHFYSSNDGGITWIQNPAALQNQYDGMRISIAVTPADPNRIYAWTQSGNFYKSSNGGTSFTGATSPNNFSLSQGVYDVVLAASPTDANTVLAGGVNLAQSTNGGQSWQIIGGGYSTGPDKIHPDFHAAVYYPNDGSRLIVGNDGGVYKSTQGSFPWIDKSGGMAIKQYYRMANSVVDHDYILAGAQDNGTDKFDGATWSQVLGADGMQPLVDYQSDNINYASSQGGNVNRSIDGGLTFSPVSPTDPSGTYFYWGHWTTPYVLDPADHHTIYYGGGAYNLSNSNFYGTILKSTDDGKSWSQILNGDVGAADVFYRVRVAPSDPQYIYASTIGQMFRTGDGGNSWTEVSSSFPQPVGGITDLAISNTDPLKIWVTFSGYLEGEKVYASTDGGNTWTNLSGSLPNIPVSCIAFQRNANDMLYIGTDFGVFYRDNSMNDWEAMNDGLPNVMVTQLDILYSFNKLRAATYGRSIWESDLVTSAAVANDAGLLAITSPKGFSCEPSANLKVVVKNFGSGNLTGATIHYAVDGGPEQIFNWSGDLSSGDTQSVDLGLISFTDGEHEITAYIANPNGLADENADNNVRSTSYLVTIATAELPITEGFEDGFPPNNWHDLVHMWDLAAAGGFNQSQHSMVAPFYYVSSGRGILSTSLFSIPPMDPPVYLRFNRAYAGYTGYVDTLLVIVSVDCFASSQILYMKTSDELQTTGAIYYPYLPQAADEWAKDSVDVSALIGMNDLQVAFVAASGFGNNLYVDDINLDLTPLSLPNVSDEQFDLYPNPTNGIVNLHWNQTNAQSIRTIEVLNSLGQVQQHYVPESAGASMSLDLSGYPKGVYLIRFKTTGGTAMKKVIAQ